MIKQEIISMESIASAYNVTMRNFSMYDTWFCMNNPGWVQMTKFFTWMTETLFFNKLTQATKSINHDYAK